MLVSWDLPDRVPQTERLGQQVSILSGPGGWKGELAPCPVDGCVYSVSSHARLVCVYDLISSCKDTSQIGLGPTLVASFYLDCLFRDPLSISSHLLRYWGLVLRHMSSGGDTAQPITASERGGR